VGFAGFAKVRGVIGWVGGFVIWGATVAYGFHLAMSWEFRPGAPAMRPPASHADSNGPKLTVVLHSQCPCSLATVENLQTLTPGERKKLHLTLVFVGPNAKESRLWDKSASIPEAERQVLSEDEALMRYGAKTSGQALLYDSSGKLVFSGGITDARGVAGRSAGLDAIHDVLDGRRCITVAPVYGCSLQTPR
jgi:hypothetical protein